MPNNEPGSEEYPKMGHSCLNNDDKEVCRQSNKPFPCHKAICNTCVDLNYELFSSELVERRIATTLESVNRSGTAGCQKCATILSGIQGFSDAEWKNDEVLRQRIEMRLRPTGSLLVGQNFWGFADLELYSANGENGFPAREITRAIPLYPSLKYSQEFIKSKLQSCKENHESCQQKAPSSLPNRVIDVGGGSMDAVKLMEVNEGLEGKYVTLSHFWGRSDKLLRTTKQTFEFYLNGIEWKMLRKTFQDAILITRALDIPYLWIDSLCIKQDDVQDWEIESAKMVDIYSNCELAIAATGAYNCSAGCLFERWSWAHSWRMSRINADVKTKIPMETLELPVVVDGNRSSVFVRPLPNNTHSDWRSIRPQNTSAALFKRAWTFQESILAPRTIHFHHEELVWACRSLIACECGGLEHPDQSWTVHGAEKVQNMKATFELARSNRRNQSYSHEIWLNAIQRYSGLRLTFETDRLTALAGLAARVSKSITGMYLAGLWESDLPRALLWEWFRGSLIRVPRIPTWSWASLQDAFNSPSSRAVYYKPAVRKRLRQDERFRILQAACVPSGANVFGSVSSGFIHIEGPVLPATWIHSHNITRRSMSLIISQKMYHGISKDVACEQPCQAEPEEALALLVGRDGESQDDAFVIILNVRDLEYERSGGISAISNLIKSLSKRSKTRK